MKTNAEIPRRSSEKRRQASPRVRTTRRRRPADRRM